MLATTTAWNLATWGYILDALALLLASLGVAWLYHETLDHAWCYFILSRAYFYQVGEPPRRLLQWNKYSSACVNTCIDAVKNAHNAMANANAWMWCFVLDTMTLIFVCLLPAFVSDGSTEIVRVFGVIGGLSLMAGNIIAYVLLCENSVMLSVRNTYRKYVTRTYFRCRRWLLRRRGRWRGRRILVESRIARPDLARKFQRRKGFNSCQLQHHAKRTSRDRRKDQRRGQAIPMLNVEVLPPSQNHENVVLPVCILLVMNPAIFPFCWQDLWEPFLCACVLERVMFVLGLLWLGWTLMVAKVLDFGMNCGALLWSCSMRRMSRRASAFPQYMLALAFTTFLMLDGRVNPTATAPDASIPSEMAPRVLRQRRERTDLGKLRAQEAERWRILQEPWFLRRRQRAERRAATRRQRVNTFLRRSLI